MWIPRHNHNFILGPRGIGGEGEGQSCYRWVSLFKSCSEQYISDTIVQDQEICIYLAGNFSISALIFLQ